MSIIVNIYYTGKNGAARKFAEEMISRGMVKEILEESGNEGYEYFLSVKNPETLLLIDRWKDRKALDCLCAEKYSVLKKFRFKFYYLRIKASSSFEISVSSEMNLSTRM